MRGVEFSVVWTWHSSLTFISACCCVCRLNVTSLPPITPTAILKTHFKLILKSIPTTHHIYVEICASLFPFGRILKAFLYLHQFIRIFLQERQPQKSERGISHPSFNIKTNKLTVLKKKPKDLFPSKNSDFSNFYFLTLKILNTYL